MGRGRLRVFGLALSLGATIRSGLAGRDDLAFARSPSAIAAAHRPQGSRLQVPRRAGLRPPGQPHGPSPRFPHLCASAGENRRLALRIGLRTGVGISGPIDAPLGGDQAIWLRRRAGIALAVPIASPSLPAVDRQHGASLRPAATVRFIRISETISLAQPSCMKIRNNRALIVPDARHGWTIPAMPTETSVVIRHAMLAFRNRKLEGVIRARHRASCSGKRNSSPPTAVCMHPRRL